MQLAKIFSLYDVTAFLIWNDNSQISEHHVSSYYARISNEYDLRTIESVRFGLLSHIIAARLFTANISISFRRNEACGHSCPWRVESSMSQLRLTVGLLLKFLHYRFAD